MKEGWENKKLSEICGFVRGPFGGSLKKNIFKLDGYAVYEQQHAIYDQFEDIRYFIDQTKFNEMKRFVLNAGDLIMSCSGTMGKIAIVPPNIKEGIINQALLKLTPSKKVDTVYLKLWLESESFQESIKKHSGGAAIQNVASVAILKQIEIQLPPLPEQQRIVSIIDKAFEAIDKAIENTQKNLQNAKELFESYLNNVFENGGEDWECKKLKDITLKIGSGATPKGGQENYKTSGISLIRSMNVYDLQFKPEKLAFIDDEQAKSLSNVTLQEDDVLLNITGASIARCCVVPNSYLPARVNQHVSIIRPNSSFINSIFLNLLLTARFYKNQLLFTGEQGSTRQALTKLQLETFEIRFPNPKEQLKIIEEISSINEETNLLQTKYQQKLRDLEELKKSILNKAFAGEL